MLILIIVGAVLWGLAHRISDPKVRKQQVLEGKITLFVGVSILGLQILLFGTASIVASGMAFKTSRW
jgi:hypothetical protein